MLCLNLSCSVQTEGNLYKIRLVIFKTQLMKQSISLNFKYLSMKTSWENRVLYPLGTICIQQKIWLLEIPCELDYIKKGMTKGITRSNIFEC